MTIDDGTAVPDGETTAETIARIEATERAIVARLEPGLEHMGAGRDRALDSIAISLKRIADHLTAKPDPSLEIVHEGRHRYDNKGDSP